MNKKILASILACAIAVSTASVVFAEGETETPSTEKGTKFGTFIPDVSTDAQSAVVNFSVPTTIAVGLDPFQAGDKSGSQIYSESQGIYNKSNIPIRVTVKAGVKVGEDDDGNPLVNLKTDIDDVDSTDISNTDKDAYVELVAEKTTATTDRSGAVVLESVKLEGKNYATEYKATGADTNAKTIVKAAENVVETDGKITSADLTSQISFALQAATYAADRSGVESFSAFAADNKGVASFRFMGSLNANATDWSGDDMKVIVVYDVNGMGTAAYDTLMDADSLDAAQKAANVYSVADATTGGGSNPSTPTEPSVDTAASSNLTLTKHTGSNYYDADPTIVIDYGDWQPEGNVTAVVTTAAYNGDNAGTENFTDTTDYTWTEGTKTLVVKADASNGIAKQAADATVTTWTLTITLTDSATTPVSKTVTATITVDNT